MTHRRRTRRRDFLKSLVAVPSVVAGTLHGAPGSAPGTGAPRPAFPPAPAVRSRRVLSDGWLVKALEPGEADVPRLLGELQAPDSSWLPARMPAQVHEVLLAHRLIPDPYLGKNAEATAWVGEKDWAYATTFAGPSVPAAGPVFLSFAGLDTLAAVYLNGREIGRFDDMYREYRCDVRELLAPGGGPNALLVVFSSPLRFIETVSQPPGHVGIVDKHKYLRKSHGDFGSYLGARPHSVKVGIYRDVVLDVPANAWLEDVWVRTDVAPDLRRASLRVAVETAGEPARLDWTLADPSGAIAARGEAAVRPGISEFTADIADPKLWWPHTHGAPHLYSLTVRLREGGRDLDRSDVRVGIRTVVLERKDPASGRPLFRFRINGEAVAMKGACWTPVEGSTHVWAPERAEKLLDRAQAASMNLLRVWAEGIVPPRSFFESCDRRGLLVWQDFMFGYGTVPSGLPAYDANVRAEIEGIVRRLRNHPSLLLWSGGNENPMALDFAGIRSDVGRDLFERVMPEVCARLDPDRPFHPSSPSGGPVPNWPLEGDFHDYTAESFSPEASVPLFTSEVGRVTPPPLRNLRRFLSEDEIWPPGFDASVRVPGRPAWPPMWQYRTFSDGWEWAPAFDSFCAPASASDLVRALGTAHGELLRERIERQRRGVPDGAPAEGRRNWGNLVWCFNDSRPTLHFGLIDYYLDPKIAYDFVRRAYEPVLLSFERTPDRIFAWVVNDSPLAIAGRLVVTRERFDGTPLGETAAEVSVGPGEARRCLDLTPFGPINLRREFLRARFSGREATLLLIGERYLNLPQANLTVRADGAGLEVRADAFARQVTIETVGDPSVSFDDNHFDLPPGSVRVVRPLEPGAGRRATVSALNARTVEAELPGPGSSSRRIPATG